MEKELYEEIGRSIIEFNSTNKEKLIGEPRRVSESIIVVPINKVNIVNGTGISEFHRTDKSSDLDYKLTPDILPYSAGLSGTSIKPIAVLVIDHHKTQLIKLDDDSLYDKTFDLLKTLIKKTIKKK